MIEGLFQPTHLIFIALIALIVLGPAKLGDLGGALGRSIREFKENSDLTTPTPATENRVEARASSHSIDAQKTAGTAIHASDV